MVMKNYLVSFISEYGKSQTIVIEGSNCKEVEKTVTDKYPTCEITRITQQSLEFDYLNAIKSIKKNG